MLKLHKDHVIETPNYTEEMGLISEMQTKEVLWTWGDRIADLSLATIDSSVAWCSRTREHAPARYCSIRIPRSSPSPSCH